MMLLTIIQRIKSTCFKLLYIREYTAENKKDIARRHNNNPLINKCIEDFKNNGGLLEGFALAESSVRAFFYNIFLNNKDDDYFIIELGGGQSTLFLNELSKYKQNINILSYEHDEDWASFLIQKVANNKKIKFFFSPLKIINDKIRNDLNKNPQRAKEIWEKILSAFLKRVKKIHVYIMRFTI